MPHDQVTVNVLNDSTVNDIAHYTAVALSVQGFYIGDIGDASTPLPADGSSEDPLRAGRLRRRAGGRRALNGPVTYMADPNLSGQTVSLLIAGSALTVKSSSSTPTTTLPASGPTTTTTTTIPSDVYANTQPEPWNPYPCTMSAPATTTTANAGKTAAAKGKAKATTTTTTPNGSKRSRPPTTSTTVRPSPHDKVLVNVLNASTVNGIAHSTAVALSVQGFFINDIGDASTQLSPRGSSEILYGPSATAPRWRWARP